jgi:hypothetical protein
MFVCSEKWPRATFLTVPSGKPEGWIASLLPHINSREKNICGNQVLRESGSFSFLLYPRNNSSSSPAANSPGSWISTGSAEITAQFSKKIFAGRHTSRLFFVADLQRQLTCTFFLYTANPVNLLLLHKFSI